MESAEVLFDGEMIKAVVDIRRQLLAIDAELHADLEEMLLRSGSALEDLWGINLYPEETENLEEKDLHVHVPEGAVPKDGPSAGITLTTALASLVTGKAVSPEIGMTGEISLRGVVMPIGGLPEKLMAAVRAGISKVLIPADNMDDLEDVPQEVRDQLEIIPVHDIEEVLRITGIRE